MSIAAEAETFFRVIVRGGGHVVEVKCDDQAEAEWLAIILKRGGGAWVDVFVDRVDSTATSLEDWRRWAKEPLPEPPNRSDRKGPGE